MCQPVHRGEKPCIKSTPAACVPTALGCCLLRCGCKYVCYDRRHVQAGAKVISMSLGGPYSDAYLDMAQTMEAANTLFVAAAGNGEEQDVYAVCVWRRNLRWHHCMPG